MINYSYYPILSGAQRDISEFDEQAILHARDNIEKYTPTKLEDIDISIWLVSTIILHNLKNNFLIKKFVMNYGKTFESHFLIDIVKDNAVRKAVLYHLGILKKDIQFIKVHTEQHIKIHIMDYLEILEIDMLQAPEQFKLINQTLSEGFVIIEIKRFVYLVRLVIEQELYKKIREDMKDYWGNERINEVIYELSGRYPETVKQVSSSPKGSSTVPPSIQTLIDKIHTEHHLDHASRIKLGIFLQAQKYDWEYIIDLFKELSDYDPKITEYQLRSLKRYIRP